MSANLHEQLRAVQETFESELAEAAHRADAAEQRADEAEFTNGLFVEGVRLIQQGMGQVGSPAPGRPRIPNPPSFDDDRVRRIVLDCLAAGWDENYLESVTGLLALEIREAFGISLYRPLDRETILGACVKMTLEHGDRLDMLETTVQRLASREPRFGWKGGKPPTHPAPPVPEPPDAEHPLDGVGDEESGNNEPSWLGRAARWAWDHRDGGSARRN